MDKFHGTKAARRRFIDGISDSTRFPVVVTDTETGTRFPYYTPNKTDADEGNFNIFPETPDAAERLYRFQRFQLVKVIINDVVEDALRNGFFIRNPEDPTGPESESQRGFNTPFQRIYVTKIAAAFMKAVKYCRLDGFSVIYFGYKDNEAPQETPPPTGSLIDHLFPMRHTEFNMETTETLPREIKFIEAEFKDGDMTKVHPSRLTHLENEGLSNDLMGQSVLDPVWDLLSVQKHADWSIGQELWRGASGLLTLFAPEGTTTANAESALASIDNLHAKTRLVLPPGFNAKDLSPSRVAHNVRHSYEILAQQIAAGTRIPSFLLFPSKMYRPKTVDAEYENFLFSLQTTFLSPLLRGIFQKFQESNQLPEGHFEIIWRSSSEDPYRVAAAKYMESLAKKWESEPKPAPEPIAEPTEPKEPVVAEITEPIEITEWPTAQQPAEAKEPTP